MSILVVIIVQGWLIWFLIIFALWLTGRPRLRLDIPCILSIIIVSIRLPRKYQRRVYIIGTSAIEADIGLSSVLLAGQSQFLLPLALKSPRSTCKSSESRYCACCSLFCFSSSRSSSTRRFTFACTTSFSCSFWVCALLCASRFSASCWALSRFRGLPVYKRFISQNTVSVLSLSVQSG